MKPLRSITNYRYVGRFIFLCLAAMVFLWFATDVLARVGGGQSYGGGRGGGSGGGDGGGLGALIYLLIRFLIWLTIEHPLIGIPVDIIVISAVIALLTGRAENNFIPGFFINAGILVVTLVTLAVRRPLIGLVASLLLSDPEWRKDRAQLRVASIATWLWVALAVIRLGVELPLYFAGATSALAAARLITGVPLYAVILWLTWLVMRTAWTAPERVEDDGGDAAEK